MARKPGVSKKDEMGTVSDLNQKQGDEFKKNHPIIIKDVGGSIANLPVNTPEYKKWLEKKIAKNGFIGHHLPAPELGTEFVLQDDQELINPNSPITESDLEKEEDVDSHSPSDVVETPPLIADSTDNKYIDLCIIENSTRLLLGRSLEDIEKDVSEKLKEYHQDSNYITPLNIPNCIAYSQHTLLENHHEEPKKLNNGEDKNTTANDDST